MMMNSVFRQKRGGIDDEKHHLRDFAKYIPLPTKGNFEMHLNKHSHHWSAESQTSSPTALLACSALSIALGQAAPNLQRRPSPINQSHTRHESAGTSDYSSDDSGSSHNTAPHSPVDDISRDVGEVPNLTSQVKVSIPRPIFEGTYSSVYKGSYHGDEIAIKALRAMSHGISMKTKIRKEIGTWRCLQHPNILPCLGYIDAEGLGSHNAIISLWCHNGNSFTYLAKKRPSGQRVQLLLDVAQGLQYLHQSSPRVIHGDLKPTNILIDKERRAKLCDFGLASLIQEDGSSTGVATAHSGTSRYLAQELVISDQTPTTATDIYALGCIALEFLFSQQPYAHIQNDQVNAYYKICREIARGSPPATRPDGLDPTLCGIWDLLEQCWDIQVDHRPMASVIVDYLQRHGQAIANSL